MVELRTRKSEMKGYGGSHHEKLELKRILYASQCTILYTAGMSPDPAFNYTNTRSFQPNQERFTPDFSYLIVSSTSFSCSSPISLFLIHYSTIIAEHKVKLFLYISPCHNRELEPSIAYAEYSMRRIQNTLSTAYNEYSIHWVQHTPSTASTEDCLSFLHSDDYKLTPECSISFRHASLWELKGKVTWLYSHSCE
jgi:hypothetical protein